MYCLLAEIQNTKIYFILSIFLVITQNFQKLFRFTKYLFFLRSNSKFCLINFLLDSLSNAKFKIVLFVICFRLDF